MNAMCRLFRWCTEHFRSQWDVRTSIVEAFATFLLLSYVNFFSASFDILIPTHVYHVNGSSLGLYMYYDATIEYFGEEHLPYALLAVFVLLVFIIFLLLLLLLYPMLCFQRCLSCCGVRWHALHSKAATKMGPMGAETIVALQLLFLLPKLYFSSCLLSVKQHYFMV